jgi:hypothetical protein
MWFHPPRNLGEFDGVIMKTAELENNDDININEIDTEINEQIGDETNSIDMADEVEEDDEDEVVISIGEESPPQDEEVRAPAWVRELRKSNREKERKIRELEARLNTTATETKPVALVTKPTLESCDYDSDEYEQKLADWYEHKREYDTAQANVVAQRDADSKAWQDKLDSYAKARASLKVRDYDEAEAAALDTFSVTQQGIVLQGSDNPALIIYAIGKSTKRAKELSSITDPVKFAFAVAKLETQLKVTNRKAAASPERTIASGGGRISGSVDSTLERLRDEALKTGDLSKVMAYKRGKK